MWRSVLAAVTGAVLALISAFVIVAILGAVEGVPVPFDANRAEFGWQGAQDGIMLFVVVGVLNIWPLPTILLAGAVIGVLVQRFLSRRPGPAGKGHGASAA